MKIPDYLIEIHHAVETVVEEIYREQDALIKTRAELAALTAATADGYRRSEFLAMNPDLDDDGLGTAIHWDTYFGVDKDRYYKKAEYEDVAQRVAARQFSVAALSGSLLQYGKQGISLHYGKKRTGCPDGRIVAGIPLNEIIWQARNQALHWEDGSFHEPTTKCFEKLATNVDPIFGEFKVRSLAFEIIGLLGWKNADAFFTDMKLLIA
ncbi:hypothetical protein [Methyloversatilis discipulorum]|uniref:hypothetical protein n=1 Tax=Methyloversatilis discipulorum TaxID=1119528 RepID=UPI0003727BB7|nr:hypothetical protein [Methyloversatilis discipulorum]